MIFNKTWKQWGAFNYKEADDALRIKTEAVEVKVPSEKMIFAITEKGIVTLLWGSKRVDFSVK